MSDDLHTPTTAAPTPPEDLSGAVAVPETSTPAEPDARQGLAADERSTTDKLREKLPEPVAQAAQTAAAKVTAARESVSGGASSANQAPADRPEILAGAAFAGGFLFALILKRLGR